MSATARTTPASGECAHTAAVLVDGPSEARRKLTVNFPDFVHRLQHRPPLDQKRLARLMAGVDLITGLAGPPDAGFGRATPGMDKEAEISVQLAAITDEALAAAEEILQTAPAPEDEFEADQPHAGYYGTELALALSRLGNDELSAARQLLLRARPAIERAVADEFI